MNRLEIAGQQLVKGNFGNAITALTMKSTIDSALIPSTYRNGNFFFGVNGNDHAFIWGNYNSSLTAYRQCPIVPAIINRKAQCAVNGKTYVMDADGKKESTTAQAKQIRDLLLRPNPYQSGKNFTAIGNIYKAIYGYCPVLVIKPVGFENDYSKWRLFNLPPWMIQVEDSTQDFWSDNLQPFKSIRLSYMGRSTPLDPNSVFFIRENQLATSTHFNTNTENASAYLPDSKLLPLQDAIDNLISSLRSRGSLIRQRGPLWILSNDQNDSGDAGMFPVDPMTKTALADDFRQYGVLKEQQKAIITDAKLKLQTVGFDVRQLQLLEGEIQDAKMICDGLNYPPYLLGLVDAKFDNQQIAERNLYTNSIIPDVESDNEQWGEIFGLSKLGLKIITDFSHLPALQENIQEQGKGRFYMNQALQIEFFNNQITQNRWRELLGEDAVLNGDKYYYELIAEGIVFGGNGAAKAMVTAPNENTTNEQGG